MATFEIRPEYSQAMSSAELSKYRRNCKQILRELWLTIHPDRLRHNPVFENLTEEQENQLKSLWQQAMAVRPEEISLEPDHFGYEYRSLPILLDVLEIAKAILVIAGIDTDVQLVIQGETLAEQMKWLEKSILRLEKEIENVQAELKILLEDRDIHEKSSLLVCPRQQQEKVKEQMLNIAEQYREKIITMEVHLTSLLNSGAQL